MEWLDEDFYYVSLDFGFYWCMGLNIGLDKIGVGVGKYMSWGYLFYEDKY